MTYSEFKNKKIEDILDNIKKNNNNSFININEFEPNKGQNIIGIKDIHLKQDETTTAGSKILEKFIAPYTSTVVKLLEENDFHIVGTLNMDEFAMGFSNDTSYFGGVQNAVNSDYIAGGSSGGSAYAVAKGLIPVATGTDTGGSVRQPAAFNGIYGMKPTYGLISRYGTIAFASSFDTIGILSNSIEDNHKTLNVLAQNDEKDSTNFVPENYTCDPDNEKEEKFNVAYVKEWMDEIKGTKIHDELIKTIESFEKKGFNVQEVSIPTLKYSFELYLVLAYSEASSNLSRYDGIRFGLENSTDSFGQYRHNFGYEVRKRLLIGAYMTSEVHAKDYYAHSQKIRTKMINQFNEVFKENDIIIGPTTSGTALKKNENLDSKKGYLLDHFLICANLVGVPSMNVPVCKTNNELPLGIQIIANKFEEKKIYKVAKIMERNSHE